MDWTGYSQSCQLQYYYSQSDIPETENRVYYLEFQMREIAEVVSKSLNINAIYFQIYILPTSNKGLLSWNSRWSFKINLNVIS